HNTNRSAPLAIDAARSTQRFAEDVQHLRVLIGAVALAAALAIAPVAARAHDETKYPDWKGQWYRDNPVQWDPTKPPGRGQQPPLTEEYQRIFEASLARQDSGIDNNAVV